MRPRYRLWVAWLLLVLAAVLCVGTAWAESGPVVRMVFFTSATCPHCQTVFENVLTPLQAEYGNRLEIKVVDIDDPDAPNGLDVVNYEMMIRAEEMFDVPSDEQGIPMLIVGGKVLVGEDEITQEGLRCLLDTCLAAEGTSWPDIPGLEEIPAGLDEQKASDFPFGGPVIEGTVCAPEDPDVCKAPELVIYAAYFCEVGCPECSRAKYHIRCVEDKYPQLVVEEFNIYDDVGLAQCLARRVEQGGNSTLLHCSLVTTR
jgi:thiol-disulfide isomerase/thioredoxin